LNDINKIIQGKNLSELDEKILHYIIEHIDDVLQKGVRGIAKDNYTSPSTIIRLAKKLGYTGFIDLYYQLLPMVKSTKGSQVEKDEDFLRISQQDFFKENSKEDIERFIKKNLYMKQEYIFIYATGFSAIVAEYLYKKLLVLGKKTIIATGTDSIGVFENNLEDIGALIVISKSGETQLVVDKLLVAKEQNIFTATFTKETTNRAATVSDLNLKIFDNNKLDDRNMLPNSFFPRLLMLIEYIFKMYLDEMQQEIK
jgi:DNA-binding MurR/RpiR family transcriptional regulator